MNCGNELARKERARRRSDVDPRPRLRRRSGGVAEWLGRGLQSLVHRFDSGPRLCRPLGRCSMIVSRALSSGGERFPDTEEVRGSNPLAPTEKSAGQSHEPQPRSSGGP